MRSTKIKKNFCSSTVSLWTSLHHMVILRNQNKITDFLMILAWLSRFNVRNVSALRCCDDESTSLTLIQRRKNVVCPVGRLGIHIETQRLNLTQPDSFLSSFM